MWVVACRDNPSNKWCRGKRMLSWWDGHGLRWARKDVLRAWAGGPLLKVSHWSATVCMRWFCNSRELSCPSWVPEGGGSMRPNRRWAQVVSGSAQKSKCALACLSVCCKIRFQACINESIWGTSIKFDVSKFWHLFELILLSWLKTNFNIMACFS